MSDCIFCRIIAAELPSRRLYEDDEVIAFLNIHPIQPGHALVIPKVHVETLLDAPVPVLARWIEVTQRVARALQQATGCPGFQLGQNNGKAAGQEVPHLHMHIIPRYENDGLAERHGQPVDAVQADALMAKVQALLG